MTSNCFQEGDRKCGLAFPWTREEGRGQEGLGKDATTTPTFRLSFCPKKRGG